MKFRVGRQIVPAGFLAAVVVLGGCGGVSPTSSGERGGANPQIVATTSVWADIATNVSCGEVEVTSLVPASADAHAFEPTVQDADELLGADLVIANGLGLEPGSGDAIRSAAKSGVKVLELAKSLEPIGNDPHVWMDPDRVAEAVPLIEHALQGVDDLDISNEDLHSCAAKYVKTLRALAVDMERTLSVVPPNSRKLVTNHESLGYFADRFQFEVIGALIPSTSSLGEPDPRAVSELARRINAADVPAAFVEFGSSKKLAEALSRTVGRHVEVETLLVESIGSAADGGGGYEPMMRTNAERVAGALAR